MAGVWVRVKVKAVEEAGGEPDCQGIERLHALEALTPMKGPSPPVAICPIPAPVLNAHGECGSLAHNLAEGSSVPPSAAGQWDNLFSLNLHTRKSNEVSSDNAVFVVYYDILKMDALPIHASAVGPTHSAIISFFRTQLYWMPSSIHSGPYFLLFPFSIRICISIGVSLFLVAFPSQWWYTAHLIAWLYRHPTRTTEFTKPTTDHSNNTIFNPPPKCQLIRPPLSPPSYLPTMLRPSSTPSKEAPRPSYAQPLPSADVQQKGRPSLPFLQTIQRMADLKGASMLGATLGVGSTPRRPLRCCRTTRAPIYQRVRAGAAKISPSGTALDATNESRDRHTAARQGCIEGEDSARGQAAAPHGMAQTACEEALMALCHAVNLTSGATATTVPVLFEKENRRRDREIEGEEEDLPDTSKRKGEEKYEEAGPPSAPPCEIADREGPHPHPPASGHRVPSVSPPAVIVEVRSPPACPATGGPDGSTSPSPTPTHAPGASGSTCRRASRSASNRGGAPGCTTAAAALLFEHHQRHPQSSGGPSYHGNPSAAPPEPSPEVAEAPPTGRIDPDFTFDREQAAAEEARRVAQRSGRRPDADEKAQQVGRSRADGHPSSSSEGRESSSKGAVPPCWRTADCVTLLRAAEREGKEEEQQQQQQQQPPPGSSSASDAEEPPPQPDRGVPFPTPFNARNLDWNWERGRGGGAPLPATSRLPPRRAADGPFPYPAKAREAEDTAALWMAQPQANEPEMTAFLPGTFAEMERGGWEASRVPPSGWGPRRCGGYAPMGERMSGPWFFPSPCDGPGRVRALDPYPPGRGVPHGVPGGWEWDEHCPPPCRGPLPHSWYPALHPQQRPPAAEAEEGGLPPWLITDRAPQPEAPFSLPLPIVEECFSSNSRSHGDSPLGEKDSATAVGAPSDGRLRSTSPPLMAFTGTDEVKNPTLQEHRAGLEGNFHHAHGGAAWRGGGSPLAQPPMAPLGPEAGGRYGWLPGPPSPPPSPGMYCLYGERRGRRRGPSEPPFGYRPRPAEGNSVWTMQWPYEVESRADASGGPWGGPGGFYPEQPSQPTPFLAYPSSPGMGAGGLGCRVRLAGPGMDPQHGTCKLYHSYRTTSTGPPYPYDMQERGQAFSPSGFPPSLSPSHSFAVPSYPPSGFRALRTDGARSPLPSRSSPPRAPALCFSSSYDGPPPPSAWATGRYSRGAADSAALRAEEMALPPSWSAYQSFRQRCGAAQSRGRGRRGGKRLGNTAAAVYLLSITLWVLISFNCYISKQNNKRKK
eukprot:gene3943-2806_t